MVMFDPAVVIDCIRCKFYMILDAISLRACRIQLGDLRIGGGAYAAVTWSYFGHKCMCWKAISPPHLLNEDECNASGIIISFWRIHRARLLSNRN
jgi:hypothetical protein